jgi:hypothetical protein
MADEPFLSRWSKRKTEARAGTPPPEPPPERPNPPPAVVPATPAEPPAPLPPVESLTPESDFTGFMRPEVDEGLKRQALKTLFQDPHYNVMDGLDVYISDFSIPDPLPESWLGQLRAVTRLGDYREPDAEEGAQPAPDSPAGAAEIAEKPAAVQGLSEAPSSDTSDTPDGQPEAPPLPE